MMVDRINPTPLSIKKAQLQPRIKTKVKEYLANTIMVKRYIAYLDKCKSTVEKKINNFFKK